MSSSPGLTILVADDSPVYRKLIAQALSQETALFSLQRMVVKPWICSPNTGLL
jgi:CheY-like chemotaxis protein